MIKLTNVWKDYGAVHALRGVELYVEKGDFISIVGRSGSGKSTLMNIIGCLDVPSCGEYLLNGADAGHANPRERALIRNRNIGFIFQSFNLVPSLTAVENVELPMIFRGIDRRQRRKIAENALEKVELADRMTHLPSQLSGGQQQRVAIARAIASDPPLILADEPTGNLDRAGAENCMRLLCELHESGHTLILITHDPDAAVCARRKITIADGKVV